jgi:AcrR family transcriptional regulator
MKLKLIIEEEATLKNSKRAALIESAIQVVAKHGFHGASICMISGDAGVAAGTIYEIPSFIPELTF